MMRAVPSLGRRAIPAAFDSTSIACSTIAFYRQLGHNQLVTLAHILVSVVHLDRDLLPFLPQNVPPPQNFLVALAGHAGDGGLDLSAHSGALVTLRAQLLLRLQDGFNGARHAATLTGPAGQRAKQRRDALGIAAQGLKFLY